MKTKVFSIFDSTAAVYGLPFFMQNERTALRSFSDLVNDPSTTIAKHPEDFALFEIGMYDDETGELIPAAHKKLGNAASYRRSIIPPDAVLQKGFGAGPVETIVKGVR